MENKVVLDLKEKTLLNIVVILKFHCSLKYLIFYLQFVVKQT